MKQSSIYFLSSMLILLIGCSTSTIQPINQPITTTSTVVFTNTPSLLQSVKTPTLIQTSTLNLPTITPYPALQSDKAKKKLFELLHDNGGCNLPCVWGNTPGQTKWNEVVNFFKQFVVTETPEMTISKLIRSDHMSVGFFVPLLDHYIDSGITIYKNENQVEALVMDGSYKPDWDASYAEVMKYYLLPQILTNYGKPSQTFILTYRDDRQRPDVTAHPFYLVLVYPDKGFLVEYEMNRETSGGNYIGCPSKSFVSISAWDPQNTKMLEKLTQGTRFGLYPNDYKSIDDATAMTNDEFFQVFTNSENKDCIQTPIETWPNP